LRLLHFHFAFAFASAASAQAPNFLTGFSETPGPPSTLKPAQLKEVTFKQRLDEQLPLEAAFKDEYGRTVTLGKYFNNRKPVILAFVYYTCPMLCTQVMNGLSSSLRALSFSAGEEFDVVVISFDPRDNPASALEKKQAHLAYWHTEQTTGGWHLLTGDEATITRVTKAAGFNYAYDTATGQYAPRQRHPRRHARRTSRALLLRDRVFAEGIADGARRIQPGPHRLGDRRAAAVLLPLRPGNRPIWRHGDEPGARSRCADVGSHGDVHVRHVAPRRAPAARTLRPMLSGIPLFPTQASTIASEVDNLYFFIVAVTAFFALLVVILVTFFAIKYRDDTGLKVGDPITGSIPLEIGWSLVPFIVAMGIFVWATTVYFHSIRPPDQTLEVYSTGKRWMWRFQHVDGHREINQLHIPLGRPIKVTFTSEDVLHDLYIPAFRVKADAIPGRYSSIWFTPTKTGEFHLFCAEYCGTRHSAMIGTVVVMEPDEYQAWLSGGGLTGSLSARGEQLFQQLACSTCHLSDGTGAGLAGRRVRRAGHAADRAEGARRRRLRSRVDPDAAIEGRERLPADHADVPGARHRRTAPQPDRVREIAVREPGGGPAGNDRRTCRARRGASGGSKVGIHASDGITGQLPQRQHQRASWLFTKDHKRIAILYMVVVTIAFILGAIFAAGIRLELTTPEGDWSRATPTTSCSPCTALPWCSSS
jgi:cytochrome c oxidase subunit 2